MALSDFFRGGRHRSHRDDNPWQDTRSRDEARNFGRPNYPQDEQGFEGRGGWRQGSDYYGDNPERYAEGGWDAVRSQGDHRGRPEYRGSENDWGRASNRYGAEHGGGMRGGSSFNDRWQNSYGGGDYGRGQSEGSQGQSGNYGSSYEGQHPEGQHPDERQPSGDQRWWNEMSGRPGGDLYSSQAGSFRGRGPKGYRRSDERIREDVCECLTDDERIDATNIQVAVKECEVTLTGSVNSRDEKRRAEDLIERLSGVKDVHNSLRIVNEGGVIESSAANRDEQAGTAASSQSPQSSSSSPSDETSSRH
jgi:osmotically-inducible protein OsmY